jgi:hypothetical protein
MKCLSCHRFRGEEVVSKIVLCKACAPVAEKIEVDIDREIERAREVTKQWLQQYILKGGLLHDRGTDEAKKHAAGVLLGTHKVQEMRGETEIPATLVSDPETGDSPEAGNGKRSEA